MKRRKKLFLKMPTRRPSIASKFPNSVCDIACTILFLKIAKQIFLIILIISQPESSGGGAQSVTPTAALFSNPPASTTTKSPFAEVCWYSSRHTRSARRHAFSLLLAVAKSTWVRLRLWARASRFPCSSTSL